MTSTNSGFSGGGLSEGTVRHSNDGVTFDRIPYGANPQGDEFVYVPGIGIQRGAGRLGPTSLNALATSAVSRIASKNTSISETARVRRLWAKMQAPSVRAHSRGVVIAHHRVSSELVVYVDSSVWRCEFDMRREEIRQEWNMRCEPDDLDLKVEKISFRLASVARDGGATPSISRRESAQENQPIPLSEEELADVARTVSCIKDKRLRLHAQKAMISIMEWKKSNSCQNGA